MRNGLISIRNKINKWLEDKASPMQEIPIVGVSPLVWKPFARHPDISQKLGYLNELTMVSNAMRSLDDRVDAHKRIKLVCDSIEKDLGLSETKI